MTRHARSIGALALMLFAGATLVGCVTGTAVDPSSDGQEVPGQGAAQEIDVESAWLDNGRMIALITEGSSTCVPVAGDVKLESDGTLSVEFQDVDANQACTKDFVARVSLVAVPEGVDPTKDLSIAVTGEGFYGDTDLDGVPGLDPTVGVDEFLPSAGWTDDDGEFVILTWGSSTCPEIVQDVVVSGPDAVTVTFADQPADRPCTMDMAPRAVLAYAGGLADQPNTVATLTGTNFAETKVIILGENYVEIPLG